VTDEQPEATGGSDVSTNPGQEFAALMSSAAAAASPGPSEAPFGWTTDRATGERRPKKTAGRPRKAPSLEELRAARADQPPAAPAEPDVAPDSRRRRGRAKPGGGDGQPEGIKDGPGVITKGVNRLYRRAGKIVRAMDSDIGTAIIEATKNTADKGEPDDSVGAAWEEVCKTNPRIRAFVLRCLAGGAWTQLIFAHAPIFMAILMKDAIRRRLPFVKLLEAFLDDDDDGAEDTGEKRGLSALMDGMTPDDLNQMMGFAQQMMGGMAAGTARSAA
jgi:hypothetical protein